MKWKKVLTREGVDILTLSEVDKIYYDISTLTSGETFTYFNNNYWTMYMKADIKDVFRLLYKKHFNSKKKILKHYEKGLKLFKEIKETSSYFKKTLNPNSNNILKAYNIFLKQFKIITDIYSITSWWGLEGWQSYFEEILSKLIKKNHLEDKTEEIVNSLTQPWKKTALLEIRKKLRKGVDVNKLVDQYQFLRSWSAVWYNPLDKKWILNLASEIKTNTKIMSFKKAIQLLNPNKDEKKILELAPYVIFFKDWRDDLRRKHAYSWNFLFELLAKKYGVKQRDIGYFTSDELKEIISHDFLDLNLLKVRKENELIIITKDKSIEILHKVQNKYKRVMDKLELSHVKKEVRGIVGCEGIVKGKVRIVNSYHDIKRVNEGDILIANTTHPNYVPAMQKAAAFVTNEGGLVCHAAIVARELKKPCIVGTKNATKNFNDEDYVEVDAVKGIVRKIK